MAEPKRVLPPGAVHSRRAAFYLFIGFLASLMPMPYNLVSLVPLVAAAVESVLCLRALKAAKAPRGMRVWSGVGLGLTVLLLVVIGLPYLFFNSTKDYQDCLDGASTQSARQICETEFGKSNDLIHRIMEDSSSS